MSENVKLNTILHKCKRGHWKFQSCLSAKIGKEQKFLSAVSRGSVLNVNDQTVSAAQMGNTETPKTDYSVSDYYHSLITNFWINGLDLMCISLHYDGELV